MSRCVNCALLLSHPLRYRQIREATDAMVNLLNIWISTATVADDDLICQECYTILERESANYLRGIIPTRDFGHKQVCLSCGISILRVTTHKVGLNVPERNFILTNVPSHLVHQLERVCARCWSNAYRRVRIHAELVQNRQALQNESAIATIENMEITTSRRNVVEISTSQNGESTSENDTIHVFCPKCKTKVPHTAAGIQQDQTKILVAKVYHYFEQEYEELKKMYGNLDLSPLSKIRQRTTLATGVSDSMLEQILEEERQREADSKRRPRPHKRRRNEDSSSDENTSDDSDGDAEADTDVQEPEQPYAAIETLVKIEQTEVNIDEPEIFVPAPLKTEPSDYDVNNEQVPSDPISLDIKTEPQDNEITLETHELNKPGTSKHKERKRTRKSQNTSTQQRTQGESSKASTSRNILMEALEQSCLWDETEFKTEEIDVHEEGFS